MSKKNCVVFSSYVPTEKQVPIAEFYLNCFVEFFPGEDVYIGVNNSCREWLECLSRYRSLIPLTFSVVPDHKVIDSDASGYQAALEIMRNHGKKYDKVFFCHTKGITHNDPNIFTDLESKKKVFFTKDIQNKVDDLFKSKYGLYSYACTRTIDGPIKSMDKLFNFYYSANDLMILESMYYIRGNVVHQFIHNCKEVFFEKNLLTLGFDRYFFERDFPTISTRFGYEYYVENYFSHPHWNYFDKNLYNKTLESWRVENNI